jgi:hypothetical protein
MAAVNFSYSTVNMSVLFVPFLSVLKKYYNGFVSVISNYKLCSHIYEPIKILFIFLGLYLFQAFIISIRSGCPVMLVV